MKVVLTGGAGFVGTNLAYYWTRTRPEDDLLVLDKLTYSGHRVSLEPLEKEGKITFIQGDVADPSVVIAALRGADLVLHLAAESHVDRSITDPAPFVTTNVMGTQVLLEACRRLDVRRFLLCSTDEVFGSLPLDHPEIKFTLDSRYNPRSPYAASKAAADHMARAYFHTYGLPVVISNCGNNYGPYQHPEKLIPLAITRLLRGLKVPLYGDGRNVRDWIYVEDHVSAIATIALRGATGHTYLVGAENELSNYDLLLRLLLLMGLGTDALEFVPDRPGHDRRYAIDPSYLRETLGWKPATTIEEGLVKTIQWYQSHMPWWEPLI